MLPYYFFFYHLELKVRKMLFLSRSEKSLVYILYPLHKGPTEVVGYAEHIANLLTRRHDDRYLIT